MKMAQSVGRLFVGFARSGLLAVFVLVTFWGGAVSASPGTTDSPRLLQLVQDTAAGNGQAQDVFWQAVTTEGLPMIEAGSAAGRVRMTFLMRSGDGGADPRNAHLAMMIPEHPLYSFSPVPGTDLWAVTLDVSEKAMGMYWFAWPRGRAGNAETVFAFPHRDGVHYEFFADPNAAQTIKGTISPEFPDREMSVFFASPAQALAFTEPKTVSPQGTLVDKVIESEAFGGPRKVSVYLPAEYSAQKEYPWVLVFDAEQYLSLMSFKTEMDTLIAQGDIPPIGAVLVHTGASRVPDLAPNPRMQAFLRDELIPWVQRDYAFTRANENVAVMGFSHGGLAALNAGLKNADKIGAVIAHSSSAWWWSTMRPPLNLMEPLPADANEMARSFSSGEKLPLRFYLDVGAWEGTWQIQSNRDLHAALLAKGYQASFRTYEGAHDYLAWREMMPGALREIFAK
jgi:enterochelin esterase family protein